jgi:hypothetical protein
LLSGILRVRAFDSPQRENAILKWTIEVQLKFLAVQLAHLSAFGGLILGGVYFIVAHVRPS